MQLHFEINFDIPYVAIVKTTSGIMKLPTAKLYILLISNNRSSSNPSNDQEKVD